MQQVGREGYVKLLSQDIHLARELFRRVALHPELEAFTNSLSITTFRYRPTDLRSGDEQVEAYLNRLNSELLTHLQESGEMYVSNAVIRGKFVLRACIVNFRSSLADVDALPVAVVRMGRQLDFSLRPKALQTNK